MIPRNEKLYPKSEWHDREVSGCRPSATPLLVDEEPDDSLCHRYRRPHRLQRDGLGRPAWSNAAAIRS